MPSCKDCGRAFQWGRRDATAPWKRFDIEPHADGLCELAPGGSSGKWQQWRLADDDGTAPRYREHDETCSAKDRSRRGMVQP